MTKISLLTVVVAVLASSAPANDTALVLEDHSGKDPSARVTEGPTLRGEGFQVRLGRAGTLQVEIGTDWYVLETNLSFPGDPIGWNRLGEDPTTEGSEWRVDPPVGREDGILQAAKGKHHSIERKAAIAGHRVEVSDTITNLANQDLAILYRQEWAAPTPFQPLLLAGQEIAGIRKTSENPTALLGQSDSGLGWLAEDDILRLQMEAAASANLLRISVSHFALRPGESHTFRYALYPRQKGGDYWSFINQARRDWKVNFTVQGPFDYFDLTRDMDLVRDRERLKAYLERKKLGVVAFSPWVDYDNYNYRTGRPTSREELKALGREARDAFKSVAPEILCIGCIEGNLVSLPPQAQKALWDSSPDRPQNQYPLSEPQMEILRSFDLPWNDCLLVNEDGRCRYELYYRGSGDRRIPMIAIAVYAAPGNGQHRYWMDQARFLIEEVGLDGLYIDQFSLAFNDSQRYSHENWDGRTVDVNPSAGEIARRYTDGALVGIEARRELAEYVLARGKYMLANTFPAVERMQSVPIHRFNESEWSFNLFGWEEGDKPPLAAYPCEGHLSTPISLGVRPGRDGDSRAAENYARLIHKAAIAYLRHGLLYYHYGTSIPEEGPGAGQYGALNHMFPITPLEIREGAVIGQERIVTCVSGEFRLKKRTEPLIRVFDIRGLPVSVDTEIRNQDGEWLIRLSLRDWAEIGVIE
ncbi:MAG: hypothetical protein HUU16_10380 [Candidatus Omnitrophica bacterium]|nr:hypothetical protein [Candidatus Omnitrophota bacterium]